MTPFILWFLGLLFVLLEFYLPGAILGTLGAIMLVASVILFVNQSTSPIFIVLFVVAVIASVIALIRYLLYVIPKSSSTYNIYARGDQEGYKASTYDPSAIGKTGVVVADLKPGGYILIEGKKFQAISVSGYISHGATVIVVDGEGESLIVKKGNKT